MCLQCVTEAVTVASDVLPGLHLMQARHGTERWPAGWFGLVACNDPMLVFPGPLQTDPCAGLSDEALDALPDYPAGHEAYLSVCDALGEQLVLPVAQGFRLMQAARTAGYCPETHGELQWWLMDHLARRVQAQPETAAQRTHNSGGPHAG